MAAATATRYDVIALVLRAPLPRCFEVVFIDATAVIDGRSEADIDPLDLEAWAVEKYADAAGREAVNCVFFPAYPEARAWAKQYYGA